ncbi:LysR family transcriptional regulator [Dickeya lacustris]|uniref:LysR family transcriptional regulator n=1 Tax=Dickeya lacustris TaxID=2259638 RepID=A0ABY8G347_9GAMM|nr:LysR family transcriptional regulator [Dickeya lacustris]WFN54365.1 LysR family transcriptional regulator [Dickeya lacustris]
MHPQLRRLDLNLLLVFDAIFRHQSVTRAASELAISNSALSHALSRLRKTLNDELFYRSGQEMRPTVFAQNLAATIGDGLRLLEQGFSQRPDFDPASSHESFTFSVTDYTAFCVFPVLTAALQSLAPHLQFQLRHSDQKVAFEELRAGRIDFALGFTELTDQQHGDIHEIDWMEDDYVALTATRFRENRTPLSLEEYLNARHLVITPWNEIRGAIDYELDKLGQQRTIALRMQSLLAAPAIIGQSNLLMTLPRFAASQLATLTSCNIHELPFPVPPYRIKIYYHQHHQQRAAERWLAAQIQQLAPLSQPTASP